MTFGRETGVYTRTKDGKMAVRMVLANGNGSNNGGGNVGGELTQEQYEELSQKIQKLNNRIASLESQIDELQSTVESLDFIVKQTSSLQMSIILRINALEKEVFGE